MGPAATSTDGRSRAWDITMICLLAGSVVLVFVYEAFPTGAYPLATQVIEWVDLGLVVFFIGEWMWRIRSAPESGKYALATSWELLGMVPILLPLPSFLRALRLIRLVRILRVFRTVGSYLGFWQRIVSQGHIGKISVAGGAVTLLGALLVWLLERDANPFLDRFSEALWWAIVTVTTVGYGDITPQSPEGRIVAAGLMVTGIGIIGLLASTLASALIADRDDRQEQDGRGARAGLGAGGAPEQRPYAPVPARAGSIAAELDALASLHSQGRLTDDEFRRAKQRVLESTG